MRTTLLIAILFAGLLNCAYTAPQTNADAVLQELQSVLAQNSPSEEPSQEPPEAIDLLCRVVGEKTVDVNPDNGRVRAQWWPSVINFVHGGGRAAGWWATQQRTDAHEQEKAEVVGLACTPVKANPNGQLTFLKLK